MYLSDFAGEKMSVQFAAIVGSHIIYIIYSLVLQESISIHTNPYNYLQIKNKIGVGRKLIM